MKKELGVNIFLNAFVPRSAVHRVRATHERICRELAEEQQLERMIMERLDQAE